MIRPPEPSDLDAFAQRIVRLLNEFEMHYAIGGSIAAMEYSEPRLSIDVDLMLLAEPSQIARLMASPVAQPQQLNARVG